VTAERLPAAEGARELGIRAEAAVARYLKDAGLAIVATNLRMGKLELDVIARDGDVIIVVEVRARTSAAWTTGFGSIDSKKRLRIRRAAERLWSRRYKNDPTVARLRIDAASVTFDGDTPTIEYAKAAF
jgi:putative endonuclease